MDRDIAISLAQEAIKAQNKKLVDQVLKIKAERENKSIKERPISQLPLIAVTCSTGWECYAIVEELLKTRKFRVRALYRTPGTHAVARLERLFQKAEENDPGLLTLHPHTDLFSEEILTVYITVWLYVP